LIDSLVASVPDLKETLAEWSSAFDRERAGTENVLIPEPGVEEQFDNSQSGIQIIEEQLQTKLREYRREYKSMEICYRDSGKEIFLIEVPSKIKTIPKNWQQMGATAKVKRYYSPEVRALVRQLQEAKETHKLISAEIQGRLYKRFDKRYLDWLRTVHVVASIDCLLSLAKTSRMLGTPSCRPTFVNVERSVLDFKNLRHPCYMGSNDFIPNDISLGGDNANLTLLTGANAAGKSTVLRMTCVATIMAQMGCYIPCEEAQLTPVDRVMTRLGANDNIFAGKSTFYVELSETKRILSSATNRSLIVLDELGRGGSSSDGFAIAEAVLHHLATFSGSLGFFATHYATLSQSFAHHPEIRPKRMAILVDDESRKVTFLYKLEDGVSPGSFGMHVATMCGVHKSIVDRASEAAQKFEHTARMRKLLEFNKDEVILPVGVMSDFSYFAGLELPIDGQQRVEIGRAVSSVKRTVNAL
jgi:DNA mismatch repair protein MSH6